MIISGSCPQEYGISNGEMILCKDNSDCEECWNREWTNTLKETSPLSNEDFDELYHKNIIKYK